MFNKKLLNPTTLYSQLNLPRKLKQRFYQLSMVTVMDNDPDDIPLSLAAKIQLFLIFALLAILLLVAITTILVIISLPIMFYITPLIGKTINMALDWLSNHVTWLGSLDHDDEIFLTQLSVILIFGLVISTILTLSKLKANLIWHLIQPIDKCMKQGKSITVNSLQWILYRYWMVKHLERVINFHIDRLWVDFTDKQRKKFWFSIAKRDFAWIYTDRAKISDTLCMIYTAQQRLIKASMVNKSQSVIIRVEDPATQLEETNQEASGRYHLRLKKSNKKAYIKTYLIEKTALSDPVQQQLSDANSADWLLMTSHIFYQLQRKSSADTLCYTVHFMINLYHLNAVKRWLNKFSNSSLG